MTKAGLTLSGRNEQACADTLPDDVIAKFEDIISILGVYDLKTVDILSISYYKHKRAKTDPSQHNDHITNRLFEYILLKLYFISKIKEA